jgi:SAM-dependent methyltransferase
MDNAQQIRESVSKTYSRLAAAPASSCCAPLPKGVAAKIAGYAGEELAALPGDAVLNSFGCGNPLAFGEVRPGDVVVDLGCGAGIDLFVAGGKVGPTGRVIGVDMTDAMVEKARANVARSGLTQVEVRKGLIEKLPVESGSADWVISNCVINLSPEKDRVFAEIARVLRPGGRMLVSDIVVEELPEWVRSDPALHGACIAGAISEREYVAGLRGAGLADVEVRHRFVYESKQIAAFLRSELTDDTPAASCCGRVNTASCAANKDDSPARRDRNVATAATVEEAAATLAGKIWSALFFARRSTPVTGLVQ